MQKNNTKIEFKPKDGEDAYRVYNLYVDLTAKEMRQILSIIRAKE
jgi:hypothetical protein